MNILIAFEFSGVVRNAFRKRGFDAFSCDLLESEDNSPYHIQKGFDYVVNAGWDLIIMHPPCTALAVSGNRWYGKGQEKYHERLEAIDQTMEWFEKAKQNANHVAMENPVGVLPIPASQYVQPWHFGHEESKKTGFWLHNLPPLKPSKIVERKHQKVWLMPETKDRWKKRSITYSGIAEAMATQWGNFIKGEKDGSGS